jgi:hypothetical protein
MSTIIRIASLPANIYPTERTVDATEACVFTRKETRHRARQWAWRSLVADAYPMIGLMLIAGYLAWVMVLGESTLPWVGDLAAAD